MVVICDTSHFEMSSLHAGPQSAAPEEQHFSPVGTAFKHLATAMTREWKVLKGAGAVHVVVAAAIGAHAFGGPSWYAADAGYVPVQEAVSSAFPQLTFVASQV